MYSVLQVSASDVTAFEMLVFVLMNESDLRLCLVEFVPEMSAVRRLGMLLWFELALALNLVQSVLRLVEFRRLCRVRLAVRECKRCVLRLLTTVNLGLSFRLRVRVCRTWVYTRRTASI